MGEGNLGDYIGVVVSLNLSLLLLCLERKKFSPLWLLTPPFIFSSPLLPLSFNPPLPSCLPQPPFKAALVW